MTLVCVFARNAQIFASFWRRHVFGVCAGKTDYRDHILHIVHYDLTSTLIKILGEIPIVGNKGDDVGLTC